MAKPHLFTPLKMNKFGAKSSAPLMSAELSSHQELLQPLYRASASLKGRFRASARFKPLQVVKQIVQLQLAYWLTVVAFQLVLLTLPTILLAGMGELTGGWRGVFWPTPRLLFHVQSLSPLRFLSLLNCICFLATSFMRKCLDFTLTCHGIHLLVSCAVSRCLFPLSLTWWLVMTASSLMMLQRGRTLCVEEELIPISIKK